MIWPSSPCPAHRSTTRPPRKRRRTRRATSQASNSSFRGRQPAPHTTRAIRWNSVPPGKRPEIVVRETGFRGGSEHVGGQRCGRTAVISSVSRVWAAGRRQSRPARAPGRWFRARPATAAFEWCAFRRASLRACLCSSLKVRRGLSFVGRTTLGAAPRDAAGFAPGAADPEPPTLLNAASALSTASSCSADLPAFRLQQTHRVVQINHAWS